MADISQGNRAELIMSPGDVYRVSTGGTATVEAVYGAPAGTTTITEATQDFGPYAANAKLIVRAVSGPCGYNIRSYFGEQVLYQSGQLVTPGGVAIAANLMPSVVNLKASNTVKTRNILASSGYRRGVLQFVGDSFIQGRGAAGSGDVGARSKAWPTQAVSILNSLGIPAQADSVCGWGSVSPSTIDGYVAYDPRVSYTGTVTKYAGIAGLGYEMFQLAAGATLTFTPGGTFDTVEVFYAAKASGATGTFTVSDAGGVKATVDCNVGTAAIQTTTVTLAPGSTYVTFTGGASASTIAFWKTRTASNPVIEAINCGQAGKPVQQWSPSAASAPYGTQASLNLLDGSLDVSTVVDGWYNDLKTPRTLTQLKGDLRSLCAWAKTKGDLWYVNYPKLNPAQVNEATFQLWSQAARDIVINEYDGVFVDISQIISDNASAFSQNLINADLLHLQKGGHTLVARAFVNALTATMSLV